MENEATVKIIKNKTMDLTITGYSTALFSTWYFVEELGLLFDCGDGVSAALLQKARKINHVFISHADRDHLAGLLQFNQLNARKDSPSIYYPKDCGSFAPLADFTQKFDPHTKGTVWKTIVDKDKIWVKKDVYVQAVRNNHVPCAPEIQKSMGYKVVQVKYKLKAEFLKFSPNELKEFIAKNGKEKMHDTVETLLLAYSGDTPCENFEHWNNAKILIHEATFLGGAEDSHIQTHGNKHSTLAEVIEAVAKTKVETLILGHFSSRYSDATIDAKIKEYCELHNLTIPVFRVFPGQIVRNILRKYRAV